jgi:hypothetical protein
MNRKFGMELFSPSMMEMRRKRDYKSLKRICDLCLELEDAIISFNDDQGYSLTPLFRAEELVNNIRIIATIIAKGIGEINDLDNKQEKENNE